jgi:hypothetical protein
MAAPVPSSPRDEVPSPGQHLATISHQGRFWDIYLEFEEEVARRAPCRARLAYSPADRADGEPILRTIPVIVEASPEEALGRAREMENHQLVAFLRSLLP